MARNGHRMSWRLAALGVTLLLGGAGVVARLAQIQLVDHGQYRAEARDEHFGLQQVRAPRGAILDRNGYPLATTIDAYDIYLDRATWQDDAAAARSAAILAPYVGRTSDDLLAEVRREPKGDLLLLRGFDYERTHELLGKAPPGVKAVLTSKRFYPEGDLASALLGFVGKDNVGLTGIEADYDRELGGVPGTLYFERDSLGNPIPFGRRTGQDPVPGGDVRLTIDRYIQRLVEQELDRQIAAHGATGGSIIVMDPRTGEVLALASRPSFRLSALNLEGDVDQSLFRNRAVTDLYEPGSVMKTVTAAIALDLGRVTPESTYVDAGEAYVGGYRIANWDFSANGVTTVRQLLQRSLNTGAVWLAVDQIGPHDFYEYLKRFGFGDPLNSGLSGEAVALYRTHQDEGWSESDLATNSFGQGIAVTPLQMLTVVASLINGGNLMQPHVVQEVHGPDGLRTFDPVVVRRVISEQTSQTMRQLMNDVVEGVPYHLAQVEGYHVGGKTGTTLVSIPTGYALDSTIASFVGFAPVDAPRMMMLIKLDQPKDSEFGGTVAAPIFADLAPRVLSYLGVEPEGLRFTQAPGGE